MLFRSQKNQTSTTTPNQRSNRLNHSPFPNSSPSPNHLPLPPPPPSPTTRRAGQSTAAVCASRNRSYHPAYTYRRDAAIASRSSSARLDTYADACYTIPAACTLHYSFDSGQDRRQCCMGGGEEFTHAMLDRRHTRRRRPALGWIDGGHISQFARREMLKFKMPLRLILHPIFFISPILPI
mgnify:CR=1 FL=1